MIIGLIYPNNYFFPAETFKSFLTIAKNYSIISTQGHSVPDNRNRIWDRILQLNDDLLFIDADMVFGSENTRKIEKHLKTYDIISGLYLLANGTPAILERKEKDYEFIQPQEGIFKIDACGAGFLGISKRIYSKLPMNPFSNLQEGMLHHGEDISFCHRANEARIKIFCDSSIKLGHIRTNILKP